VRLLLRGETPERIRRELQAHFAVDALQAQADLEAVRRFASAELDDEANVSFFVVQKLGQLEVVSQGLYEAATQPLPQAPSPVGDPDDPTLFSPRDEALTVSARAQASSAKSQAAKAFADITTLQYKIVGRRSQRYGEKPLVAVSMGPEGMTPEQQAAMQRLLGE
jgi:hypothetical protein